MAKLPITGVVLAGGQGRRVGGQDKGLLQFKGEALYQHVLQCLQPQVSQLMINANRHLTDYQQSGYPVYSDELSGYQGPLAGILRGMQLATTDWLLFASCDTPFLPADLAERLWQQHHLAKAVFVTANQRQHPTLLLIHRQLTPALSSYLAGGERKLRIFLAQQQASTVDFGDCGASFVNLNTPEELQFWQQQ